MELKLAWSHLNTLSYKGEKLYQAQTDRADAGQMKKENVGLSQVFPLNSWTTERS